MNLESFRKDMIELLRSIELKLAHPAVALNSRCEELESSLISSQNKFNELTNEIQMLEANLAEERLAGRSLEVMEDQLRTRFREADRLRRSIVEMGNELERMAAKKRH